MTNYQTGHDAEKQAADYLQVLGYIIRELNWKTRYCEIDIVAENGGAMFFFEVKHRKSKNYGDGFDQITPKKLRQMGFAAEMWVSNNGWAGDYQLGVVSSSAHHMKLLLIS